MKKLWLPCLVVVVVFFGATMAFANGPTNPLEVLKIDSRLKGVINPDDKAVFWAYDHGQGMKAVEFHIGGDVLTSLVILGKLERGTEQDLNTVEELRRAMRNEEKATIALMAAEHRVAFQLAQLTIKEFEQGKLTPENWRYRSKYFRNFWLYTYLLCEDTNDAYSLGHDLDMIEEAMAGNWLQRAWNFLCGHKAPAKVEPAYRIITPFGELGSLSDSQQDGWMIYDFIRAAVKESKG